MGVLQYILLRKEKETGKHKKDSDTREQYSKYMKSSASGDLTHNTLRIATCYLGDDLKEDCFAIIRRVTEPDGHLFMKTHNQRLKHIFDCCRKALDEKQYSSHEIALYNNIIDIDLLYQNPYKTTEEFEKLKEKGFVLFGYDAFNIARKQCYFDVTFMLAELPVLPTPAAMELLFNNSQKHVSFHPFLYGLLLEYILHEKYGSGNRGKKSILEKMENCVSIDSMIPDKQKSVGLNFMAYCYSLQRDYLLASRCLVRSLKLNTVRKNVAYCYMFYKKYRIKRIRELSLDS
ncbi:unnamed protein product [Mytilus coruscus]|uniref:Uncharacterized protein n=1 Tax=Mytilus coruscus TaxID=42192 RepID=A0A6J8EQ59_MYTCO|nr:unnamed protein product [Mytilus coruscus]